MTLHQHHGHQGVECTLELVRQRCYWPGMSVDVVCANGVSKPKMWHQLLKVTWGIC